MTGAELVALIAVIGTTLGGVLTTLFHSRCKTINACFGCLSCEREVLHEQDINNNNSV